MSDSDASTKPTPLVDDSFWFGYSKTFVEGSAERRDKAAEVLQKLVLWLWGIYTASTAIGFGLAGKELSFWSTVLIATASGVLILVYWGTVWVQVPSTYGFDPRSPTDIERTHSRIVRSKSRRLAFTLLMSVVAAVFVSVAIVVASVSKPLKPTLTDLRVALVQDGAGYALALTAQVGDTPVAKLDVTALTKEGKELEKYSLHLVPNESGLIQTSVHFKTSPDKAQARLAWTQKSGTEIELTRIANRPKSPEATGQKKP
jgi:hypothetical protein